MVVVVLVVVVDVTRKDDTMLAPLFCSVWTEPLKDFPIKGTAKIVSLLLEMEVCNLKRQM